MKTTTKSALLFSTLLLIASGTTGCALSVEADIPSVEVTARDLQFEAVPSTGASGDVSMTRHFSQQHQRLDLPAGLDSEVSALGVTLTAKSGVPDLTFIHNLRVTMSDGVHDPIELVDYQQPAGGNTDKVLSLESTNPVNALDQWKTDSATFTLEVAGALPSHSWTADMTVHFAGSFKYRY
jgi:hypothetical protein